MKTSFESSKSMSAPCRKKNSPDYFFVLKIWMQRNAWKVHCKESGCRPIMASLRWRQNTHQKQTLPNSSYQAQSISTIWYLFFSSKISYSEHWFPYNTSHALIIKKVAEITSSTWFHENIIWVIKKQVCASGVQACFLITPIMFLLHIAS